MKRAKLLILVFVVGAGTWWLYRVLFPPDETVIRRLLVGAAEAASVQANESAFDKLGAVNRLVNRCTVDIEILLHIPGIRANMIKGRDQLREAVAAMRGTAKAGEVTLMDIGIDVEPGRSPRQRPIHSSSPLGRSNGRSNTGVQSGVEPGGGRMEIRRVEPIAVARTVRPRRCW